ncbi:MAG: pyruvate formate lyase family protein [Eubacteriales bacterium]
MNERIARLTELTLSGKMYVSPVKTEFEEADMLLPKQQMESKHLCEYILNQEPKITEYSCMTGFFNMDSSVVGDAFRRGGHKETQTAMKLFYLKPVDNLSTMEWQHATADFSKILDKGLSGIISDIDKSLAVHTSPEQTNFLHALENVANALILWAYKCSKRVLDFSVNIKNEQYRKNLRKLAQTLLNVPRNAPSTFYEAILCIYTTPTQVH